MSLQPRHSEHSRRLPRPAGEHGLHRLHLLCRTRKTILSHLHAIGVETVPTDSPPELETCGTALFLDLDGTLAEIAARPQDVGPAAERTAVLRRLAQTMEGRLAVLTGRSMPDADRILDGAVLAMAAVHGLERRNPHGGTVSSLPARTLGQARSALQALADSRPGLLVEDKGSSVAIHYRGAPSAERDVKQATSQLALSLGLVLQDGSMVSELRTPGPDKGDSLRALLDQPPFKGSRPIAVGDDLTDEAAFAAAEDLGGYGVLVGAPRASRARYRLETVADVLAWLDRGSRP